MDVNRYIKGKFRIKGRDVLPYSGWLASDRNDLSALFAEVGFKYGAEIGVWTGAHAKSMFKQIPGLKLLCVDPWTAFGRHSDSQMERLFQRCQRRLRHWDPVYRRMPSEEAARRVEDGSLDFVYIDGLHDFDNVMLDLIHWSPKVKVGGVVSGHDYAHRYQLGIIPAVDAYTYAHGITEWYITGGQVRADRLPSFFWVRE